MGDGEGGIMIVGQQLQYLTRGCGQVHEKLELLPTSVRHRGQVLLVVGSICSYSTSPSWAAAMLKHTAA